MESLNFHQYSTLTRSRHFRISFNWKSIADLTQWNNSVEVQISLPQRSMNNSINRLWFNSSIRRTGGDGSAYRLLLQNETELNSTALELWNVTIGAKTPRRLPFSRVQPRSTAFNSVQQPLVSPLRMRLPPHFQRVLSPNTQKSFKKIQKVFRSSVNNIQNS